MNEVYKYYRVKKVFHNSKGERYFKILDTLDHKFKVLQVCIRTGAEKKGRANLFGIYFIGWSAWHYGYNTGLIIEECSKEEFETSVNYCMNLLNNQKLIEIK